MYDESCLMVTSDTDTTVKKSYYAVIPADVRYNENLEPNAKLLYGEITALCNQLAYCWASNKYFADLYGKDDRTIRRWLSSLESEGFVYVEVTGKKRKIFLTRKFAFDPTGLEAPEEKEEEEVIPTLRKKKDVKYTDEDILLAEMLLSKIIANFPVFENKKVKTLDWADDMRKLREIDGATPEQVRFMIMWVHGGELAVTGKPLRTFEAHDFWSKNILSAGKLRKQWFTLVAQLQDTLKKSIKKSTVLKVN